MDVARSNSKNTNKTIIAPLKIRRNKDGRVTQISLVNLISVPNGLNFTGQSIEIKRAKKQYRAKMVVVDANGLGVGLVDALLKDTLDPRTGESLGCWDTINTENQPDEVGAEKVVYALKAMGTLNHDMIVNFMDMVESQKLQLLLQKSETNYHIDDAQVQSDLAPFTQTDLLIEEVANLKLKPNNNNTYTVEQLTKKVDKDRYSALVMGLWYIKNFEDKLKEKTQHDPSGFFFMKKPKIYG